MSRTYREIPNGQYRKFPNVFFGSPLEEKKHASYTKRVRDKDNVGTHRTPKDWRKAHQRRYRSNVNDRLRKIEQAYWDNPSKKIGGSTIGGADPFSIMGMEVQTVLPRPKEFQPYYW